MQSALEIARGNDPTKAGALLHAINVSSGGPIALDLIRALIGFVTRHSEASRDFPSQVASGVGLVALVGAVCTRFNDSTVGGSGSGYPGVESGSSSGSGGGGVKALSGEEVKELGTQVTRLCSEAAVRAALSLGTISTSTSQHVQYQRSEALCLPIVAAFRRGFALAPVVFRRCVSDAVVLSTLLLRLSPPHTPLGRSTPPLLAAACYVALRNSRTGRLQQQQQQGEGGGSSSSSKKAGHSTPLDATPLVRSLLAPMLRSITDLARLAAYAPLQGHLTDPALASTILATLPMDGCAHTRASEALVDAVTKAGSASAIGSGIASGGVSGGGGGEGGESTVRHTAARACGLAAALATLLAGQQPQQPQQPQPQHQQQRPFAEDVAIPLGEVLAACESLCDAGSEVLGGGGGGGGGGVHHASTAASAALQDSHWRGVFEGCVESLAGAGLGLLTALFTCGDRGGGGVRRYRTLTCRVLLTTLRMCQQQQQGGGNGGGGLLSPSGRVALQGKVLCAVAALLKGPGVGIPTPDTCPSALALVHLCLATVSARIGSATTVAVPLPLEQHHHPSFNIPLLSLPLALSSALTLVQHAWSLLPDDRRLALEHSVLALAAGGDGGSTPSGAAPSSSAAATSGSGGDGGGKGKKRTREGEKEEGGGTTTSTSSYFPASTAFPDLLGLTCHALPTAFPSSSSSSSSSTNGGTAVLLSSQCASALGELFGSLLVCPWAGGSQSPLQPRLLAALSAILATTSSTATSVSPALLLGALANRLVIASVPINVPAGGGGGGGGVSYPSTTFPSLPLSHAMPSHVAPTQGASAGFTGNGGGKGGNTTLGVIPSSSSSSSTSSFSSSSSAAAAAAALTAAPESLGEAAIGSGSGGGEGQSWSGLPLAAGANFAAPGFSVGLAAVGTGGGGGSLAPPRLSQGDAARLAGYADALGDEFPSF